jgi:hypothetical protein
LEGVYDEGKTTGDRGIIEPFPKLQFLERLYGKLKP